MQCAAKRMRELEYPARLVGHGAERGLGQQGLELVRARVESTVPGGSFSANLISANARLMDAFRESSLPRHAIWRIVWRMFSPGRRR
jgi:hypothetical protein